jgi:hypothetical protein
MGGFAAHHLRSPSLKPSPLQSHPALTLSHRQLPTLSSPVPSCERFHLLTPQDLTKRKQLRHIYQSDSRRRASYHDHDHQQFNFPPLSRWTHRRHRRRHLTYRPRTPPPLPLYSSPPKTPRNPRRRTHRRQSDSLPPRRSNRRNHHHTPRHPLPSPITLTLRKRHASTITRRWWWISLRPRRSTRDASPSSL